MIKIIPFLLLKLITATHEPRGILCKLCMMFQDRIFNGSYDNLQSIESFLVKSCHIYENAPFCKYFVDRLGDILLQNRINYFLDNNYFCSHYFNVCDQTTVEYDFDKFRKHLYDDYPIIKTDDKIKVYKEFNILTLNDIHIQTDYEYKAQKHCKDPGGCCSKYAGPVHYKEDEAGYWGSPGMYCDLPVRTFDATLNFLKKNLTEPTFIVVLGDNFGHNYFREDPNEVSRVNEYVYSNLKTNFTQSYILPVLGNHECDPVDNLNITDPNDYVYKHIFPSYKPSIDETQISNLITKGFYTAYFDEYGVKFISINSQIFDAFNGYMARNSTDPLHFFQNFVDELYAAENLKQKVILLSHIPIVDTFSIKEFGINLRAVLGRFKNTIIAFFSAHTHNDSLIFVHDNDEIINLNYVSPSLTTFASYNPSFRVYQFDNAKLVNYLQYASDLDYYNDLANKGVFELGFSVAYDFRKEYEIQSWETSNDFKDLRNKIFGDSIFTDRFIKNYATSKKGVEPFTTKGFALCSTFDTFDEFSDCMSTELPYRWGWHADRLFRSLFVGKWFVKKVKDQ